MTPIDAATLVLALTLGVLRIVSRELDRAAAEDLRSCGVVIVRDRVLESHSQPIGDYMGHQIWATVTFRGMVYDFNRVQPASHRERLAPGELYLEPGLVYVTGRG